MVFSSVGFLFFFLPLVLASYFIVPFKYKNAVLLLFSLIFYAWGEPQYILLMIVSILLNYGYGIWIETAGSRYGGRKLVLASAIVVNLSLLGFYKYANFVVDVVNTTLHTNLQLEPVPLPVGISFYTFHALSYLIDVYRRKEEAQRNLFRLSLYITFFPQLVAGPIIRYHDIAAQLRNRVFASVQFAEGIQRFMMGLAKKILLANPLGAVADDLFAAAPGDLSTASAWIGIVAYTGQIYFDFSGYSDMAIGLAKMFGFEFKENFNYPYIAGSISEFWRRWHISLGSWFRDYVYIPLGGSRTAPWRLYRNLLIVWALTGFWHGASWTFMAWGAYYGVLIALEKAGLEKLLHRIYPLNHIAVMLLVMIGWVFFRADDFDYAAGYLGAMFDVRGGHLLDSHALSLLSLNWFYFAAAVLAAVPIYPKLVRARLNPPLARLRTAVLFLFHFFLFGESVLYLINSTYNPFLYFRF
ncbi:MBOAT family O-acyltransferase [Cohnella sp. GCM10012308]|uniref:MBOAT family O-acyltransferase n=1 Tax=Cohnella sp. GCM10012308 TaxID=3317329 RepID=UPI003614F58F